VRKGGAHACVRGGGRHASSMHAHAILVSGCRCWLWGRPSVASVECVLGVECVPYPGCCELRV